MWRWDNWFNPNLNVSQAVILRTACRVLRGFDRTPQLLSSREIVIIEQQLTQTVTHVPLDAVRQHAQKHMSPNAIVVEVLLHLPLINHGSPAR
jgi:hypothetical protein